MNTTTKILQALDSNPQTAAKLAEGLGMKVAVVRTVLSVLRAAGVVELHRHVEHVPGQRGRRVAVWRLAPGYSSDNVTLTPHDSEV